MTHTDLITRLHDAADRFLKWVFTETYSGPPVISIPRHEGNIDALLCEAADALTAQQNRIEVLEGALMPFAGIADLFDSEVEGHSDTDELSLFYGDDANWLAARFTVAQFNAARAASQ